MKTILTLITIALLASPAMADHKRHKTQCRDTNIHFQGPRVHLDITRSTCHPVTRVRPHFVRNHRHIDHRWPHRAHRFEHRRFDNRCYVRPAPSYRSLNIRHYRR